MPAANLAECHIDTPVRLSAIALGNGMAIELPGGPTLDCGFAAVFAEYVRNVVAPLGIAMLGSAVSSINTGPGYVCRGRDGIAGAKTSAHGKGLAIDIVEIVLADQRRIAVAKQTAAAEIRFVETARTAGCGWFTTVLGPGSDPFHASHMHVDTERHGSGKYRICE